MGLHAKILAGLIALGVLLPASARADTIQSVYLCGSTVEILLAGPTTAYRITVLQAQ